MTPEPRDTEFTRAELAAMSYVLTYHGLLAGSERFWAALDSGRRKLDKMKEEASDV